MPATAAFSCDAAAAIGTKRTEVSPPMARQVRIGCLIDASFRGARRASVTAARGTGFLQCDPSPGGMDGQACKNLLDSAACPAALQTLYAEGPIITRTSVIVSL